MPKTGRHPSRRVEKLKKAVIFLAPVLILLAISLIAYRIGKGWEEHLNWYANRWDSGGYRFIAEHFWGVPHDSRSYISAFSGLWGQYLERVPFRSIGVGSYYLAIKSVFEIFHTKTFHPNMIDGWWALSLKFLFAISYVAFFATCRKFSNATIATICTAVLVLPFEGWRLTNHFLSEPLLRILFVLICAVLLLLNDETSHRRRLLYIAIFFLLALISAQVKSQWMLMGLFLTPVLLFMQGKKYFRWRNLALILLFAVSIPSSLFLVNVIGWGVPAIAPGLAFHVNHKYNDFFPWACKSKENKISLGPLCDPNAVGGRVWKIPLAASISPVQFGRLDALAFRYVLGHPARFVKDFSVGIRKIIVLPSITRKKYIKEIMVFEKALTIVTLLVLMLGLLHRRTRFLSAIGLSFLVVLWTGFAIEQFSLRYSRPVSGIPLAFAILIVYRLRSWWQNLPPSRRTIKQWLLFLWSHQ